MALRKNDADETNNNLGDRYIRSLAWREKRKIPFPINYASQILCVLIGYGLGNLAGLYVSERFYSDQRETLNPASESYVRDLESNPNIMLLYDENGNNKLDDSELKLYQSRKR